MTWTYAELRATPLRVYQVAFEELLTEDDRKED